MTIGQFRPMNSLSFGYHLNANSEDMMDAQDGSDTSMAYTGGILGPAAYFNGSSSKIYLGTTTINAVLASASFSMAALIKPATGFSAFPVMCRGFIERSSKFYGFYFGVYATLIGFYRWQGTAYTYNLSLTTPFTAEHTYLVGVTYNKSNGAAVIYKYPLYHGEASKTASTTLGTGNVAYNASYDVGWHLGANLRNVSNEYAKGSINEFLIFNDVRSPAWYNMYYQWLKGHFDWE